MTLLLPNENYCARRKRENASREIEYLPEAQGEDYEELDFANRMKKKKKRRL